MQRYGIQVVYTVGIFEAVRGGGVARLHVHAEVLAYVEAVDGILHVCAYLVRVGREEEPLEVNDEHLGQLLDADALGVSVSALAFVAGGLLAAVDYLLFHK